LSAASGNVLVVYRLEEYPLRSTVSDHLYSVRRYSDRRVFYLNLGLRPVPRWLPKVPFDIVLFHTSLLSGRWAPGLFEELAERARPLRGVGEVRIMAPQDEFFRTQALTEFARDFDVNAILSVSPESEWSKQYPGLAEEGVRFREVLTGYLDDATVKRVDRIVAEGREREISIGYRAWHASPWLGSQGQLKTRLAEVFDEAARERGLRVDISTRHEDTILGDDWLRYLAGCRYTIGVEGGATVLDADGTLNARTESYLADHPDASYEEVEAACFPGRDGELKLKAISPRHFEACATRTCQILIEGDYNGVLRAGEHYIELKEDFSNLESVLDEVERDERREQIAERAYRDVVASGDWTYARFVADLDVVAAAAGAPSEVPASPHHAVLCWLGNALDQLAIVRARVLAKLLPPLRMAARRVLRRGSA
jgi:hypothetical protein